MSANATPPNATSDPPVSDGTAGPERTNAELYDELMELEKQFPPPTDYECSADARAYDRLQEAGQFEPFRGMCVAVLNGAIVGYGRNEYQLRLDVVRKFNVAPHRPVIGYIELGGNLRG